MRAFSVAVSVCLYSASVVSAQPQPQPRVEKHLIFGMYSGLALLMDVYRPTEPNGFGIVAIQGSGWYSPMRYDAPLRTDAGEVTTVGQRFAAAGYTVFSINHRSSPRFRYPDAVEDAQRAVRFVRFHAAEYGISPERIGAWGGSSGSHLVSMLATLDGQGDASDSDPANRVSAKVQAVVTLFAPSDMVSLLNTTISPGTVAAFMGFMFPDPARLPPGFARPDDYEAKQYRQASPLSHVSRDDAPALLMHGDKDVVVPIQQSEIMQRALEGAGVPNKFIRVPGGQHGPNFLFKAGDPQLPDHVGEALRWFDQYLKARPPAR